MKNRMRIELRNELELQLLVKIANVIAIDDFEVSIDESELNKEKKRRNQDDNDGDSIEIGWNRRRR